VTTIRFFFVIFALAAMTNSPVVSLEKGILRKSERQEKSHLSKSKKKEPLVEKKTASQEIFNFEKMTQSFVLETKRIKIPRYPNAFNPSITRWRGKLLMSFRFTDLWNLWRSKIGLVWLDENFDPVGKPQLLNTRVNNPYIPSRTEDARLVTIGDRLFVIYNDSEDPKDSPDFRKMFLCEILFDGESFSAKDPEGLKHYEGEAGQWEKNWVPFDYHGSLLLAYSINPHLVFKPERGTEKCSTISSSSCKMTWDWGTIRGGTPALLLDNEYLAFFHSSKPLKSHESGLKEMYHYFMGAYKFKREPPFNITKISSKPIIGKGFYKGPHLEKRVVFPGGFVFDEKYFWVIYGRDDSEVWIVKLDRNRLLQSLVSVD
jgi:predicted GH43/DUF377 family glycosyl hydrolase